MDKQVAAGQSRDTVEIQIWIFTCQVQYEAFENNGPTGG
jgi:hypothetical protein